MSTIKRVQVYLNIADPYQKKVFDYINKMPNRSETGRRFLCDGYKLEVNEESNIPKTTYNTNEIIREVKEATYEETDLNSIYEEEEEDFSGFAMVE